MTDSNDIYDFIQQTFRTVFTRDIEVTPLLCASDVVGWDSFKQVEITLALEERYNIRIRARELARVANLADLVGLVLVKLTH